MTSSDPRRQVGVGRYLWGSCEANLPGGGGLELAKALLKVYPRIKILLMSASYAPSTAQIFGEMRNRPFLLKPFSRQELLQTVEDALS